MRLSLRRAAEIFFGLDAVTVIFDTFQRHRNTSQSTTNQGKANYRGDPSTRQPLNFDTFNFFGPQRASEGKTRNTSWVSAPLRGSLTQLVFRVTPTRASEQRGVPELRGTRVEGSILDVGIWRDSCISGNCVSIQLNQDYSGYPLRNRTDSVSWTYRYARMLSVLQNVFWWLWLVVVSLDPEPCR